MAAAAGVLVGICGYTPFSPIQWQPYAFITLTFLAFNLGMALR